jgi:hypothetical protein
MLEKNVESRYDINQVYSEMKRVHLKTNDIFEGTLYRKHIILD